VGSRCIEALVTVEPAEHERIADTVELDFDRIRTGHEPRILAEIVERTADGAEPDEAERTLQTELAMLRVSSAQCAVENDVIDVHESDMGTGNPASQAGASIALACFTNAEPRLVRLAGRLTADPEAAVADARRRFEAMIPDLAYVDKPAHPLAPALFVSTVNLALYLALADRGVDVHSFGRALLTGIERAPIPPDPNRADRSDAARSAFVAEAERSLVAAGPGEDVFEFVDGDGESFDYGLDVRSCAVCHQFGRHGAMELVPYMCAVDDLMSAKHGEGLRRTGTLALGADHCDFRYQTGREGAPLAPRYPEKIRWP